MAPASYIIVFNPADTPAAADDEGRVIAGGTHDVAHASAEQVKAALTAGRLVAVELGEDPSPEARDLFKEVEARNKRAGQFGQMSAEDLHALAVESALGGETATKAELVHALTMHPSAQATRPAAKTEE